MSTGSQRTYEVNLGGGGFAALLTTLFIGLKLTGHISWSWWWVFAPLWLPVVVILAGALIVLVFVLIAEAVINWRRRKA